MSRTQTRRSVSLNRQVYEDSKAAAEAAGMSLAKYVEAALKAKDPVRTLRSEVKVLRHVAAEREAFLAAMMSKESDKHPEFTP